MDVPIDISPEFVAQHAKFVAIVLGALLSIVGGYVLNAIRVAAKDLKYLKNIQGVQAENHLSTIQAATLATRDELIKNNAKMDVLISVIERKL